MVDLPQNRNPSVGWPAAQNHTHHTDYEGAIQNQIKNKNGQKEKSETFKYRCGVCLSYIFLFLDSTTHKDS